MIQISITPQFDAWSFSRVAPAKHNFTEAAFPFETYLVLLIVSWFVALPSLFGRGEKTVTCGSATGQLGVQFLK